MPIICWGALGKAADDPTTIDDEIAAYILRHNVDPNAHNLGGYSLNNHRVDDILDHPDYSVVSDKITADQIVGKDFRTAPNVGSGVDGIKFDRNAIEMWEGGYQKVYIPKSGNPRFEGVLTVQALRYFARIIQVNCQSLDPFVNRQFTEAQGLNIRVYTQRLTYNMGRARLNTGVTDDEMQTVLNPSLEITASMGNFPTQALVYMGLGNPGSLGGDDTSAGFVFDNGICYMMSRQVDNNPTAHMYMQALPDINIQKMYIYRVQYDYSNHLYLYFVNNIFRGQQYAHWPIGDLDQLCDIAIYPKTSRQVETRIYNIIFQQDFPSP